MSSSPKPLAKHPDRVVEPLIGSCEMPAPLSGKGDLSDWVELMEAVEALCPVWPERSAGVVRGKYKL